MFFVTPRGIRVAITRCRLRILRKNTPCGSKKQDLPPFRSRRAGIIRVEMQWRGGASVIENRHVLERLEREFLARDEMDHARKLAILEAMRKEAVALKAFPPRDPLEGIEVDIMLAKVVNSV